MNTRTWALPICAGLLVQASLAAPKQNKPHSPKPGSPERKAILDSLRKPVEKEVKQKVVFYNVTLRVKNGWAYAAASAQDSKGKPLKAWEPDLDIVTQGLLRKQGKQWKVLFCESATDGVIIEARRAYPKAPKSIFPSMPDIFPHDGPSTVGDGFNNKD